MGTLGGVACEELAAQPANQATRKVITYGTSKEQSKQQTAKATKCQGGLQVVGREEWADTNSGFKAIPLHIKEQILHATPEQRTNLLTNLD